jgi:hypothetical protein
VVLYFTTFLKLLRIYDWLGYPGQRLPVGPEKVRILVVISLRESYMDQVGVIND